MTALKVAIQKFPVGPSISPDTTGELQSLEETLVWRWCTDVMKTSSEHIESDLQATRTLILSVHLNHQRSVV